MNAEQSLGRKAQSLKPEAVPATSLPSTGSHFVSAVESDEAAMVLARALSQEETMKNKLAMAGILLASLAGTAGIASAQDYRFEVQYDNGYYSHGDYDRDDGYYGRYNFREGMRAAREFGWRDGCEVAREDMWRGKRFNPNPRGRFDDADHGYRREFGSIHEYREHYADAYRAAYQNEFARGGRYWR